MERPVPCAKPAICVDDRPRPGGLRRLLVVSHVTHYRHEGRLHAYGPYVREIEIWADLCTVLEIAAPCRDGRPPELCLPIDRPNVTIAPQRETGGTTLAAKVRQAWAVPGMALSLCRAMRRADAVHVRCPGNLGLLAVFLAPLMSRRIVAKYAGQWTGYPGEAWSYRLQRRLLGSRWWRGPVTVYGRWPDQPPHVVPFFTSILTAEQMERARRAAAGKRLQQPLEVLYVGRLSAAKNVDVLIRAVGRLAAENTLLRCTILGDGPQRAALEALVAQLNLQGQVVFAGGVAFEQVLDYYQRSHALILASQTEGWPKAIAEAMAFGLVCVGSDRGLVPEMLGEGRGLLVPPGDVAALSAALRHIASSPENYAASSSRAAAWGQRYSLEDLREALRQLLSRSWNLPLEEPMSPATPAEEPVPA